MGEGPQHRPFCDLRYVPEASRLREQVDNGGRACIQVLLLSRAELGFFHFLEIVKGWLVPSTISEKKPVRRSQYSLADTFDCRRSCLLKTGFFRQVRELKIRRKNLGSAFRVR
jgi:hypothetical protein